MTDSLSIFLTEAEELLETLEESLFALESAPEDSEIINQAFRALHTLKGSGGMFGFDNLCHIAHRLETMFDKIRSGERMIDEVLIEASFQVKDVLANLIEGSDNIEPSQLATINSTLDELIGDKSQHNKQPAVVNKLSEKKQQPIEQHTYQISLKLTADSFTQGFDPLPLFEEMSAIGSLVSHCQLEQLPTSMGDFDPEHCYLNWIVQLTTTYQQVEIESIFVFVNDVWSVAIDSVDALMDDSDEQAATSEQPNNAQEAVASWVSEALVDSNLSASNDRDSSQDTKVNRQKNKSPPAVSGGSQSNVAPINSSNSTDSSPSSQSGATASTPDKVNNLLKKPTELIKVDAAKLDALMDMVGEIVINQARLNEVSKQSNHSELASVSEDMDRLINELRDLALNARMMPLEKTFTRFKRLVRDTAKQLDKQVDLEIYGEETELDKTVIDKLADPLVHLVRNSLDHGIETSEERLAADKPEAGKITIGAFHQDSNVVITIEDDGKGIDKASVLKKAISKGIVNENNELSDRDIFNLIFEPGFSTAAQVTDLSGRGVGMDVVKRSIEQLRGHVEISSELGHGTRVQIRLPLTLAIIEGLLCSVSEERYIVPLDSVEECIELKSQDVSKEISSFIRFREDYIPVINLREWLHTPGHYPEYVQIVIVRCQQRLIGLMIDDVIGQNQTVIKGLGDMLGKVDGVSGATILGDGKVALIIDINRLAENITDYRAVSGL